MARTDPLALSVERPRTLSMEAGSTIACNGRLHVPVCLRDKCSNDFANGYRRDGVKRFPRPIAFVLRLVSVPDSGCGAILVLHRMGDAITRRAIRDLSQRGG